ncbi:MAG: triose-phosphate isomerase [Clostridiales bacterium]|jgi:triosephosphate isomerase|nr:triose-phosphate isomerase [Clostridiales bacterium]
MGNKLIAGNWKMNFTVAESVDFIGRVKSLIKNVHKTGMCICAPFTSLHALSGALRGTGIALGAQNIAWADKGAFTGEINAAQLKEAGVEYTVIGHSERRHMFGETDETVRLRTAAALKNGFAPIVCVGETDAERTAGKTESVLKRQTVAALTGLSAADAEKTVFAYEPVWAIGTGKNATPADADGTVKFIRGTVAALYGAATAEKIKILYGGSMNAANCADLLAMPHIDGGLIGGASLKAEDFNTIIQAAERL